MVVQRFFNVFLEKLLPCDGKTLLIILRGINVVLTALVLLGIIDWIRRKNGDLIAWLVSITIALFIQCFAMFVQNLYWIPWTLLLPMAAMMIYFESSKYQNSGKHTIMLFIISFAACLVKELCYFEFITSVMIAMALPLFYTAMERKYKITQFVKEFAAVVSGAISSFIIVLGIKIMMFWYRYGVRLGMEHLLEHLDKRLVNGFEFAPGGTDGIKNAVKLLLRIPAVSVRSVGRIDWLWMIILCLVSVVIVFILNGLKWSRIPEKMRITILVTTVSLLAPLSWAVMAAPHTCIHYTHCSVVWFCGFYFFAVILIFQTVFMIVAKVKEWYNKISDKL